MIPFDRPAPDDDSISGKSPPQKENLPSFPNPQQDQPIARKKRSIWATLAVLGVLFLLCGGVAIVGFYRWTLHGIEKASQNRLRAMMLGIHNYESAEGYLIMDRRDEDGTPLLSWRVAILPFIEGELFYSRYDQDIAWNQGKNVQASSLAPRWFLHPTDKPDTPNTPYQAFSGPGALLDPNRVLVKDKKGKDTPLSFDTIPDGAAHTLLLAEARTAVPYAQPIDINFPGGPTPLLGYNTSSYFLAANADGSIRKLKPSSASLPGFVNAVRYDDGPPPILD